MRTAPSYTVTEEGDLLLFGAHPDYPSPEAAPWFSERARIVRVVAEGGCRVGANACAHLPELRVAELSGAREIGVRAFAACPRLTVLSLSPRTVRVAANAFEECRALAVLDFAGSEAALSALGAALPTAGLTVRTLPTPTGETVASGEVGGGFYSLTEDGILSVDGAAIPDYRHPQDAPWYPYREAIRTLLVGEDTTRIGERAFASLPVLSRVVISGRPTVAPFAFASCRAVTDLCVLSAVTEVGAYAFAGTGVTVAMMPPSLRHIPEGLFDSCRALSLLVLPVLPTLSARPFTAGCGALSHVRFFGTPAEHRALARAVGLSHGGRLLCGTGRADLAPAVRALETAERAHALADSRRASLLVQEGEVLARLAALPALIDAEEEAYHTAETRRRGFADGFDAEGETHPRRLRRAERNWQKEEARREGEEQRAERATAAATANAIAALLSLFKEAVRTSVELDRAVKRAQSTGEAARLAVHCLYPYATEERRRAERLLSEGARLPAASRTSLLRAAHDRCEAYRALQGYRRFSSVREGVAELARLLGEGGPQEETAVQRAPRILVVGGDPLEDAATAACLQALRRAGAVPVAATEAREHRTDRGFDALLLCDGGDVDPYLYRERRHSVYDRAPTPVSVDERRDLREYDLFCAFYRYGKPILGIGRGCQLINAALGGTLSRALPKPSAALHSGGREVCVHELEVLPASFLFGLYEPTVRPMRVTSRHTSAIREVARELTVLARAKDGTVEAVGHTRLPVIGVQFLPEAMLPPDGARAVLPGSAPDDGALLFSWFVRLCIRIREKPLSRYAAPRFSEE